MYIYICYLLLTMIQIPFFYGRSQLDVKVFHVNKYLSLCCVELVFLAGLRGYTVGADTDIYLMAIEYYSSLPLKEIIFAKLVYPFDFEWGYFILTKICAILGIGRTGFLFVVALITYIPIFKIIEKYSPMPYISILCYFSFGMFSYSLGLFRQMIALSILLCGLNYIINRNLIKYMAVVIAATTFHTTAVVSILLYFLYGVKWKSVIGLVIPLETILIILGRPIIMLIVSVFPKYSGYLGSMYDVQGGSYMMLLLLNIIIIFSVIFRDKKSTEYNNLIICALILAICMQCLGYSMGIFGRAVSYFSIYLIIAVPNLIQNVKKRLGYGWKTLFPILVVICMFVLAFLEFSNNKYIVPYYTVFSYI